MTGELMELKKGLLSRVARAGAGIALLSALVTGDGTATSNDALSLDILRNQKRLTDILSYRDISDDHDSSNNVCAIPYPGQKDTDALTSLLKKWAKDYYTTENPESDPDVRSSYDAALEFGAGIGLNLRSVLELPRTPTMDIVDYTEALSTVAALEKRGIVLGKYPAVRGSADEIVLGRIIEGGLKTRSFIDDPDNTYTEIMYEDLLSEMNAERGKKIEVERQTFWAFERAFMNIDSAKRAAHVYRSLLNPQARQPAERESLNQDDSNDSALSEEDFRRRMLAEAGRYLRKGLQSPSENPPESYVDQFVRLIAETRLRYHEPEHNYDLIIPDTPAGNSVCNHIAVEEYNETRAFLVEIARSENNAYEFGFLAG